MAASITQTITNASRWPKRPITVISLAWTSHTDGSVSGIPTTDSFGGHIERIVFIPSGSNAPSNLYDVTLRMYNGDGLDLMAAQGANLSDTVTTHVKPGVPFKDGTTTSTAPIAVDGQLELVVANAGSGKQGTVVIYLGS